MNQLTLFKNRLPKKPYCTDFLESGLRIRNTERALGHRYIQPNHPNSKLWLVYDIDRQTCVDEITEDLGLPAPHFFVQNPDNQHAHVYYGLETPVHLNPDSSKAAIRFAGAVDVGITQKIKADPSYSGLIAKNPIHQHWRVWTCSTDQYELSDIAEFIDLNNFSDRRKSLPEVGLGRNVAVFEKLRVWSYKSIRQGWPDYPQFLRACEDRAAMYNASFETSLPFNEIKHIAKSVAKWTHARFSPGEFSAIQASRGSKGGKISKRGCSENSERTLKPWEKLGISRATYYRRKCETK